MPKFKLCGYTKIPFTVTVEAEDENDALNKLDDKTNYEGIEYEMHDEYQSDIFNENCIEVYNEEIEEWEVI